MLVLACVLPARDEYLERLGPWLRSYLSEHSTHRPIIGPYAQWQILHRARRRAARRGRTTSYTAGIRGPIRSAVAILGWLANRGIALSDVRQPDIDEYLDSTRADRHHVRAFLRWSARHRLSPRLDVPVRASGAPSEFLTSQDRWRQLECCLSTSDMPLAVRVIGALMLLYGFRAAQLLDLTIDAVTAQHGTVYLKVGKCPLQLPPAVAVLATHLAGQQRARHDGRLDDGPRWLFTSRWALHPLTPGNVADHLRRHGVCRHAGRNTALLDLAADMPAAVIPPMLGLTKDTLVTWNGYARIDGNAYLRARQRRQRALIPLASK